MVVVDGNELLKAATQVVYPVTKASGRSNHTIM